ncbi:MAG TPA: hypothetical protein ACHBX0_06085 [Arsenophonus sp.]
MANIKHSEGAIDFFTNGLLSLTSVYQQALILTLISIQHKICKELNVLHDD